MRAQNRACLSRGQSVRVVLRGCLAGAQATGWGQDLSTDSTGVSHWWCGLLRDLLGAGWPHTSVDLTGTGLTDPRHDHSPSRGRVSGAGGLAVRLGTVRVFLSLTCPGAVPEEGLAQGGVLVHHVTA